MLSVASSALLVGACAFLLAASAHDIAARSIPNSLCLALLIVGCLYRVLLGGLGNNVVFSAAVFFGMFGLWLAKLVGGGDVKLAAATAMTVPSDAWLVFILAIALAGGVLSLIYLALSLCIRRPAPGRRQTFFARIAKAEAWRISQRSSIPYGAAIAVGALYVLLPGLPTTLSR